MCRKIRWSITDALCYVVLHPYLAISLVIVLLFIVEECELLT